MVIQLAPQKLVVPAHSPLVFRLQYTAFASSSVGRRQARGGFKWRGGSSLGGPRRVSFESQTPHTSGSFQAKGKQGFHKFGSCCLMAPVGGYLALHWSTWRDRQTNHWLVEVLRVGYHFLFLRPTIPGSHSLCKLLFRLY